MARCGPFEATEKATVWRDEQGQWYCDQERVCRKCGDLDWGNNEYDSWAEAMSAAQPVATTGDA